ncbi:MAG: hypothetical protein HRU28_16150 [Rhizobiales bacterium]|nr:hypothetical protein [Hyphomicrobiales bacterium]
MKPSGCSVCGYQGITVLDEFGCTTFEICKICNCESGYEYSSDATAQELLGIRCAWLKQKPPQQKQFRGKQKEITYEEFLAVKIRQLIKMGLKVPEEFL